MKVRARVRTRVRVGVRVRVRAGPGCGGGSLHPVAGCGASVYVPRSPSVFNDPEEHFVRLHVSYYNKVHVDIYRYRVCVSRRARTHTAYGSTHK